MIRIRTVAALLVVLVAQITSLTIGEPEFKPLIIDGDDVPDGSAPSIATLSTLSGVRFCGATILSNRWVVTAAQCTRGRTAASIGITPHGNSIRYIGSFIIEHPGFEPITLANDISMINTTAAIPLSNTVQAAILSPFVYRDGLWVHIYGWGMISSDGEEATTLQRISTRTITNRDCRTRYASRWDVTDTKICSFVAGGRGICYGDEGGGLFHRDELIGIASWHSYCSTDVPNVFELLLPHRLWIRSYI